MVAGKGTHLYNKQHNLLVWMSRPTTRSADVPLLSGFLTVVLPSNRLAVKGLLLSFLKSKSPSFFALQTQQMPASVRVGSNTWQPFSYQWIWLEMSSHVFIRREQDNLTLKFRTHLELSVVVPGTEICGCNGIRLLA